MNKIDKAFDKWRKKKFVALNGVSRTGSNGWIITFGERAWKQSRIDFADTIKGVIDHLDMVLDNSAIAFEADDELEKRLINMSDELSKANWRQDTHRRTK